MNDRSAKEATGLPAGQRTVRTRNLALALRRIADAPEPVSRADIAAATGLTRATSSSLVDELVACGLVAELPPTRSRRGGRPAVPLALATEGPCGLGIEINVDYVALCVIDLAGQVRHREVVQEDQRGRKPRTVLNQAARRASKIIATVQQEHGLVVSGIALALPGLVDRSTGLLHVAPNLGWRNVDVLSVLTRTPALADLPVTVENEANFAALVELIAIQHADLPSFIHVSGEVGIGAGIVLEGSLYRGLHGWAGEIGHVVADPAGPPCRCGSRGCLEQYAGQEAIIAAAGIAADASTALGGTAAGEKLAAYAKDGHAGVLGALATAGRSLGITLAAAINLLDIDRIVLGGVYRALAPWLTAELEREVREHTLATPWTRLSVESATHGAEAAMVGAGLSVVSHLLDDPAGWSERVRT